MAGSAQHRVLELVTIATQPEVEKKDLLFKSLKSSYLYLKNHITTLTSLPVCELLIADVYLQLSCIKHTGSLTGVNVHYGILCDLTCWPLPPFCNCHEHHNSSVAAPR